MCNIKVHFVSVDDKSLLLKGNKINVFILVSSFNFLSISKFSLWSFGSKKNPTA